MANSPTWGVFGLGFMPGKAWVVSTYRIQKKKGKKATELLFNERLIKITLHELGHNFGLDHCSSKGCFMADAEGSIQTVDNEKFELCEKCKKLLKEKNN